MARKTYYIGSQGPFFYDDDQLTADGQETQNALFTEGHVVTQGVPTQPDHTIRLEDIEGAISSDIFTTAGQLLVAVGPGAFTVVPPPSESGLVLTADLTLSQRMKWAEPTGGSGGDGGGTGGGAGIFVGAKGYRDGQSIPSGVFTKIEFSSALFDEGGMYDGDRLIAPYNGKYIIVGNVSFTSYNADNWLVGSICVNGGLPYPFMSYDPNTIQTPVFTGVVVLDLEKDDYVQLFVRQNSGVSKDIQNTSLTMVMLAGIALSGGESLSEVVGGYVIDNPPPEPFVVQL